MAQPKFFLQPLAAAICVACYSASACAEQQTAIVQTLAPIVATAHQGNDANGLIVHADPKQPIQPIPASDGADYLQSIMGFSSIKNGGTNGDVTFRGMFGSRIKILADGNNRGTDRHQVHKNTGSIWSNHLYCQHPHQGCNQGGENTGIDNTADIVLINRIQS